MVGLGEDIEKEKNGGNASTDRVGHYPPCTTMLMLFQD
jgi:hypothetical protein